MTDDRYMIQDLVFQRADRQGIKMADLARRIGTTRQQINNWRRHNSQMRMEYAEKCFEALNEHAKEHKILIY